MRIGIVLLYLVAILQSYGQISVLAILEIFLGTLVGDFFVALFRSSNRN